MSVQQFCLRWNNHQPNFISVCSSLLHNGTLVDVTLAAEGKQLQAHKIVLSACSSYFQTLFTTNPCKHPIVILKDVQYNDLKTMVDFMYYGEVNVSQEQLPHILKTAEMLKIKGLAEMPADAATLTKSEKSDHVDQLQAGGMGPDSIWGSAESQFQQQHQQQQQQQQQQQHQQQQQQQQQQSQHHLHGNQQGSQTTNIHQLRRSPSPGSVSSPVSRKKRARKTSNNGQTTSDMSANKSCNIDQATNINLNQINQIPFSNNPNVTQTLHTKIVKEMSAADQQQETSLEGIESHQHHIKPENDIGVQQSMQQDMSGAASPSDYGTTRVSSQPQSSHAGVQWTVVDSNYNPRFSLSSCQSGISLSGNNGNEQDSGNNSNNDVSETHGNDSNQQKQNSSVSNNQQQQGHIQIPYQESQYSSQIISVNNLVGGYSQHQQQQQQQNISTPTSPNESAMVQSVYSQGPTPTPSPVSHQISQSNSSNRNTTSTVAVVSASITSTPTANNTSLNSSLQSSSNSNNFPNSNNSTNNSSGNNVSMIIGTSGTSGSQQQQQQSTPSTTVVKRKRSVNPQADENFIKALEAVRTGGIGFCKAARIYGVNNRTLWLEYKKRGYLISRPSIKNRIKLEPNISPPPPSTPTNEETSIENYEHLNQSALNIQVPPPSETPTSIMCTPHTHMGVMSFLDTRHISEFPSTGAIHSMSRQRYTDAGSVNVNSGAMNLQGLNFNSM